jgi:hypothetical protein
VRVCARVRVCVVRSKGSLSQGVEGPGLGDDHAPHLEPW